MSGVTREMLVEAKRKMETQELERWPLYEFLHPAEYESHKKAGLISGECGPHGGIVRIGQRIGERPLTIAEYEATRATQPFPDKIGRINKIGRY